jgi:hypothetical protein
MTKPDDPAIALTYLLELNHATTTIAPDTSIYGIPYYFMLVLTVFILITVPAKAQTHIEGGIVYSKDTAIGRDFVSFATGQSVSVLSDACPLISLHLTFLATVNLQVPDHLVFYDLATGNQISQVTWQSIWTQTCRRMYWLDDQTLVIPTEANPEQVYHVDVFSGTVTGPFSAQTRPMLIQENPWGSRPLFSPDNQYVVYDRCDQAVCGNSRSVIYDLVNNQVVTILVGDSYTGGRPIPPEMIYRWSYSGRYLIHFSLERKIAIYDMVDGGYLDLAFLPVDIGNKLRMAPLSWSWSPDETKVGFWVSQTDNLGYGYSEGVAIVDLQTETFSILDIPTSYWPVSMERWGWSPSGESLLIQREDNTLYELNLADGNQTFIDNNISEIWFWYTGVPAINCSSTIPVTDTPALLTAIISSNTTPESDTICLEAGIYTLDAPITSDITLVGLGAGAEIIGSLQVSGAGRLTLRNVTVTP